MDKQKYKEKILNYFTSNIFCSIFFLILIVICIIFAFTLQDFSHRNNILYKAIPLISLFPLMFLINAITYILLLKPLNKITSDETINKTINCIKVKIKLSPISKHYFQISKVTLICKENNKKQKYYYIPLVRIINYKEYKKNLYGSKQINIYKDTNIIKSFGISINEFLLY